MFYNVPPSDPLYQSLDFFIHISEPIKDAVGVSWCTGSGYIARRSALNDIGQIPIGSVAEDVLTSTLLLGDGWRTCYVHEPLQHGTVPDDFGGHIKQRTRWVCEIVFYAFSYIIMMLIFNTDCGYHADRGSITIFIVGQ